MSPNRSDAAFNLGRYVPYRFPLPWNPGQESVAETPGPIMAPIDETEAQVTQPMPAPTPMAFLPEVPASMDMAETNQLLRSLIAQLQQQRIDPREPQSHLYRMPPDGYPFNEAAYVALPALAATANIIQFTVPGGVNGVIRRVGNNFVGGGFQEGSGSLIYQITAETIPIRNHQNILGSLGSPASPSETDPIRIYEGQTIALTIQNVSIGVAGQLCGGRLSGYFYPMEYDGGEAWGG